MDDKAAARQDPLTGLYDMKGFLYAAGQFLENTQPGTYAMAALDIEHFRMINKFYGRDTGDKILMSMAGCLKSFAVQHGGIAGHFSGDNFCIILPFRTDLIRTLWDQIRAILEQWSHASNSLPAFGVYKIDDLSVSPEMMYDRATVALTHALGNPSRRTRLYDPTMEHSLEQEWRVLADVRTALSKDEFTFFAQPQCDISTGKIVGAEALVRWIHKGKVVSPGAFIPVLEKNYCITQLDKLIWTEVVTWLQSWMEKGYRPVPISINISRLDILSMDVAGYLTHLSTSCHVPPRYIKCEITESAYAEESSKVNDTVKRLRKAGFLVMMDDFGSGYSSLNTLKSMAVDVLKIDMDFLNMSVEEEHKGIGILESVVNIARLLGIPIILEGVENQHHENFMRNMGCRYAQGYYYFKPLPISEFEDLLADQRRLDLRGMHTKQVEALHARELMDGNLFTDTMINNILGAAAFYDVYENQIEITRVNEQYFQLSGADFNGPVGYARRLWDHVRDDDRPLLFSLFERAYENRPSCSDGYIHYLRMDGRALWVYIKLFFLRERDGHRLFFGSLVDITSFRQRMVPEKMPQQKVSDLTGQEHHDLELHYGNLPCGYGLSRILLDPLGRPFDYEIIYINQEMEKNCGGDRAQLRHLILKVFGDDRKVLLAKAYQAAFLGETVTHYAYSSISSHYLQLTLYQHRYGYVACLMRDVTHMQIHEGALNSMLLAYREVYFIHLRDNYCRMIYPDASGIMERGNYEAVINRHFATGKILRMDEENIRRFLSLENLKATLLTQDSTEYRYRRSAKDKGIDKEWCLTSITVSEREDGLPKTAVLTIRSIDAIIKEEEDRRRLHMAESLASMSDGFLIYRAVNEQQILYANPAVMTIFGCDTMDEFMDAVGGSFKGLVHPEDLERVQWEIEDQIRQSAKRVDCVQYRILRKDGQIRWIDDYGHLEGSQWGEEHRLFYVFIKDITDTISRVQKEKLLNSNQFYKSDPDMKTSKGTA